MNSTSALELDSCAALMTALCLSYGRTAYSTVTSSWLCAVPLGPTAAGSMPTSARLHSRSCSRLSVVAVITSDQHLVPDLNISMTATLEPAFHKTHNQHFVTAQSNSIRVRCLVSMFASSNGSIAIRTGCLVDDTHNTCLHTQRAVRCLMPCVKPHCEIDLSCQLRHAES